MNVREYHEYPIRHVSHGESRRHAITRTVGRGMTDQATTSPVDVGFTLSRRWLLIVVIAVAAASAAAGAVTAYRWIDEMIHLLAPMPTTANPITPIPEYVMGPRDYLPALATTAATTAAFSLLCSAIGAQLLRRRPWRSVIALGAITAVVLIGQPYLALAQEWLAVATIWAGTILLWCSTSWSTRRRRDGTTGVSVGSERVRTPDLVPADTSIHDTDAGADEALARTTTATQDLALDTRRTAIALVVAALSIIIALIAFSAVGGLQMVFGGWDPWWSDLAGDAALLAWLAIWAGWLSGRRPAGPFATTWRVVVVVAILLPAILELTLLDTGSISIVMLTLLGAFVATTRHRLADRAEAMLSP